MTFFLICHRIT